jgi:hypothetical protein
MSTGSALLRLLCLRRPPPSMMARGTQVCVCARRTELTGGESLAANVELVLNNAEVAAQVAVALCELRSATPAPATTAAAAPALGGSVGTESAVCEKPGSDRNG